MKVVVNIEKVEICQPTDYNLQRLKEKITDALVSAVKDFEKGKQSKECEDSSAAKYECKTTIHRHHRPLQDDKISSQEFYRKKNSTRQDDRDTYCSTSEKSRPKTEKENISFDNYVQGEIAQCLRNIEHHLKKHHSHLPSGSLRLALDLLSFEFEPLREKILLSTGITIPLNLSDIQSDRL
jgi:chromosomal replication initiation ATPase DnaA